MHIRTKLYLIIPLVILIFFVSCERAGEDILVLMPEKTQLVFENEYVRVLNITLEPGDKQPLHFGENRLIYALSNYTIKYYLEDDATEIPWNEGGIHWHEAGKHAVENVGETIADYLVIERKAIELSVESDGITETEVMIQDTEYATAVFENDYAHVVRVHLPAGSTIPEHDGINRLVYSLSDYTIRYTSEIKGTVETEFEAGDIHWHSPGVHSVENIGDSEASYIVFSLKQ